jgi:hypothetical protein
MMAILKWAAICAVAAILVMPAGAGFTLVVDEASITALTGFDAQPEDIAVDAAGNIIVADEAPTNNEMLLRFDSVGGSGVIITDEAAIKAALDAANGTDPAPASFTINSVSVAADGDIVLTNGDGGAPDCLVTVSNVASPGATITVVSCNVSGTPSPVEGCTASTVIGNNAYVAVNGAFGAAQDAILAVDTNSGSAPAAPAPVLASQASIEAATAAAGGNANMGPLVSDGSVVWVADSAGAGTSDDIFTVDPGTGVVTLQVAATDTEADLAAADIGYTGIAVDGNGNVWGADAFGSGNGDNGVLKLTNVGGGTADTFVFSEAEILTDLAGAGTLAYGRGAFSPVTGQVLFASQGNGTPEGIIGIDQSFPAELSVFSTN